MEELSKSDKLKLVSAAIEIAEAQMERDGMMHEGICFTLRDYAPKVCGVGLPVFTTSEDLINHLIPEMEQIKPKNLVYYEGLWWTSTPWGDQARIRAMKKIVTIE